MPLYILLIGSFVIAVVDWLSVASGHSKVEAIAKPLVIVPLIVAVIGAAPDPDAIRWLVAAGLAAGMVGDILLLPRFDQFIGGLGAFLVGHLLYIAAFVAVGTAAPALVAGIAIGSAILWGIGRPIVDGVAGSKLAIPVAAYIATIGVMIITGVGTAVWLIAGGAVLFALSDGLLGTDRFVTPRPDRRVWVHVTYQVAQISIAAGVIRL